MLGKLLKYEIKATARVFMPLYAVLMVFAAINRLISMLSVQKWQAPEIISMILYIMVLAGIFVVAFVVMIQRFYKNLLSDEGYLMFTLPAKGWKHIASKLVVAMMWIAVSGIAAIVSILVNGYDRFLTADFMQSVADSIREFFVFFGASSALVILEVLLILVIGLASSVLLIYVSIALGHLFNRHRILGSLGAFIVVSTVTQILFAVITYMTGDIGLSMVDANTPNDFFQHQAFLHYTMWFCIIFFGLLSAGYFALTNYILSRRLNLE